MLKASVPGAAGVDHARAVGWGEFANPNISLMAHCIGWGSFVTPTYVLQLLIMSVNIEAHDGQLFDR